MLDSGMKKDLQKLALKIRIGAVEEFKARGFGHVGGSLSVTLSAVSLPQHSGNHGLMPTATECSSPKAADGSGSWIRLIRLSPETTIRYATSRMGMLLWCQPYLPV